MGWFTGRAQARRAAVARAAERRLAGLADQWRVPPAPPPAGRGAGPEPLSDIGPDPELPYRSGPSLVPWTRSAVRGLALLLAVALALAGYWAWSGRPRAVAMAPDVLATGAPFPVDAAAVLEPPGAAGSPGVAPDVSGGGTSPASAEGATGPNALMTPGSPTGSGPGPSTAGRPELVVHVAGLVSRPGLVRLPAGSRVADAVAAAGGVTKRRAADTVNLARLVVDGEQIVVGGAASGQASVAGPMAASDATPPPLDLNAATQDELEGLPGIGPVIAARIIGWRTTNGAFRSVEELGEVSGIGTAILSQVRTLVRV